VVEQVAEGWGREEEVEETEGVARAAGVRGALTEASMARMAVGQLEAVRAVAKEVEKSAAVMEVVVMEVGPAEGREEERAGEEVGAETEAPPVVRTVVTREDFPVAMSVETMAGCSGVMRVITEARTVEKRERVAGRVAGRVAVKVVVKVGAASAEVGLAVVEQVAEGWGREAEVGGGTEEATGEGREGEVEEGKGGEATVVAQMGGLQGG
jgi:hypothetical protein